jgi:hypothetical protein
VVAVLVVSVVHLVTVVKQGQVEDIKVATELAFTFIY